MKTNKVYHFALIAVLAGLFLTASARAATFTVDRTDDATVSDCTAAANDCTLRGAIAASNVMADSDVINFDSAIFSVEQTITLSGSELLSFQTLTINGPGANLLTISGDNKSRVFNVARLTMDGVTITKGNSQAGSLGGCGGGILVGGGTTLTNSTVRGNVSNTQGGGICVNTSTLTLTNSTVSGNIASTGGGIFATASTSIITNSTISGNTATIDGGGGIQQSSGNVRLTNSTISGNTVNGTGTFLGGGISNTNGSIALDSVTITQNRVINTTCTTCAGGFLNVTNFSTNLNNNIIAGNTVGSASSPDYRGSATMGSGYNLIGIGTGVGVISNGDNFGNQVGTAASPLDPKLDPTLRTNGGTTATHALLAGSPALDKGRSFTALVSLTTDQRGQPRPVDNLSIANATGGDGADIGAFEDQAPTAADATVSGRVTVGSGKGLTNAYVLLTDQRGLTQMARTTAFGYFRFAGVAAGQSYTVSVQSKLYRFASQVITVNGDVGEINFISERSRQESLTEQLRKP